MNKRLHRIASVFTVPANFFKKRFRAQQPDVTIDELSNVLELTSVVNFGHTVVSEIMCPRINVIAADIEVDFDKITEIIVESGFSRIPVYADTLDTIKGILYTKDILPHAKKSAGFEWQTLLRPPYFVPETKKINALLKEFQKKKIQLAVVIDEYGGTSGIVTMEDILEEIVGEITDESDVDETLYRKLDFSTYIFKGHILLDDFCKAVDIKEDYFDNERGEAETLAGLLLEITGEIPQKGNVIEVDRFKFSVESADKRRIKEIRVKIKKENSDAENV